MPITIATNITSLKAQRQLDLATAAQGKAMERLSSGLRINRAADDAAGLAVASSLNTKARVYDQAVRNVADGISYLSVVDGAAEQLSAILDRAKELATQSANGVYTNQQRQALDAELTALQAEYGRIVESTVFNSVDVLSSEFSKLLIQAGFGSDVLEVALFSSVTTQQGQGNGTFQVSQSFSTGNPRSISVNDFNGDGILDLVTADSSNTVSVLLGNGN